jgi:hypothetical protein
MEKNKLLTTLSVILFIMLIGAITGGTIMFFELREQNIENAKPILINVEQEIENNDLTIKVNIQNGNKNQPIDIYVYFNDDRVNHIPPMHREIIWMQKYEQKIFTFTYKNIINEYIQYKSTEIEIHQ